ncbi:hypothetical protein DICVIV_03184 [Dictyocaulus viviparus]|uniref:Uncharacterized protein n=1 Tax=Dictyocaulus viviparus TaxID=29172 RepID=A0A0D8Y3R3_DICVI|nr:hypothetical protein DICVIV_03184 [Dictyocaulus viviparus]
MDLLVVSLLVHFEYSTSYLQNAFTVGHNDSSDGIRYVVSAARRPLRGEARQWERSCALAPPLYGILSVRTMFILPFLAPPTHMRAQPPQQYYQPQQMFVQQQQFFSGPQYSRQPGIDYDPHQTAMSTVYMSQEIPHPTPIQMQPPPQPIQQQRNKNILTIRDPNTLEVVDLCAKTDSALEVKKDEVEVVILFCIVQSLTLIFRMLLNKSRMVGCDLVYIWTTLLYTILSVFHKLCHKHIFKLF